MNVPVFVLPVAFCVPLAMSPIGRICGCVVKVELVKGSINEESMATST